MSSLPEMWQAGRTAWRMENLIPQGLALAAALAARLSESQLTVNNGNSNPKCHLMHHFHFYCDNCVCTDTLDLTLKWTSAHLQQKSAGLVDVLN